MKHVTALFCLVLALVSCAGPKVSRVAESTTIKTPAMSSVTITLTKEEMIIQVEPVPWWKAAIEGVTGGLFNAFTKSRSQPSPSES